jgi:hypothetical protein
MSELQARIDALRVSLRPHAADPVTVRRRATDSAAPAGTGESYPRATTLDSRRRGGQVPNTYRMRAADYANGPAPLTRTAPGNGARAHTVRIADGGEAMAEARAEDARWRGWANARRSAMTGNGATPAPGTSYPSGFGPRGGLAVNPSRTDD